VAATAIPAPPETGGYEISGRGARPAREQSVAAGKEARKLAPLASHRDFFPAASRDPIGLLLGQAKSRVPELVPVRHGRMMVSPFTYYRGAALPMAADLATMTSSGLRVQLCGDAHLLNFGVFGSPERRLVFDLSDLREFAATSILDVWYARFAAEDALGKLKSDMPKKRVRQTKAQMAKARTRDSTQALAKLTTVKDGGRRIISDPPSASCATGNTPPRSTP
jgi:hypothetical protein